MLTELVLAGCKGIREVPPGALAACAGSLTRLDLSGESIIIAASCREHTPDMCLAAYMYSTHCKQPTCPDKRSAMQLFCTPMHRTCTSSLI